jgi:hypothetical protein
MIDDHRDFHCAISANIIIDPALARELSCQWEYRHQIHSQIASRLRQTSRLNGFTGALLPGTREGQELMFTVKAEQTYLGWLKLTMRRTRWKLKWRQ